MAEKIRVRCPVCGMMTDQEQMTVSEQEKPTEVRVFRQKFGGKVKTEFDPMTYVPGKKGKSPGIMEYTDITSEKDADTETITAWFVKRAKAFLAGL